MRFFKITLALSLLLTFFSFAASAQNGSIRGFVYFKKTAESAPFSTVYLQGTTHGVTTNLDGFFSLTQIPAGTYTLVISQVGHDTIREVINLKAGEIVNRKFYLTEAVIKMDEVVVEGDDTQEKLDPNVSELTITQRELKAIPTVTGEAELAQYLQILPGVIFTGDQGGQLYIRGGSPIQNKVLLDGMVIYNPFHSIGLFSVFDADIIRNADVFTGGFGAEYGGRISSIMDITTRDGNKKRVAGKITANPFSSKVLLEGPLQKQVEDVNKGTSSFVLSAKHSYLDRTSKIAYSYVDTGGLPFDFTDLYGKLSFNASNGSKFNIFGFNFRDHVRYRALSDFGWTTYGIGSNFLLVPASSSVLVDGVFAYSKYKIGMKEELQLPDSSSIGGFNMGLNFTYFRGVNEIKYGIEVLGFKTDFTFYNSVNRKITQQENTTELAGYVKYKIVTRNKKLLIEPSFRAHYYASLQNFSPEPRLGMKYNATDKLRFKLAAGIYSQNLISATSDRDVVNLFYGFLSGPENLPTSYIDEKGQKKEVTQKLQKANHIIIGAEYDLFKQIDVNLEIYQKDFTQLTNINRNKLYEDDGSNFDKPDMLKKDFIIETGKAQGVDLLVKYDHKRLYIWAVYSLGYVTRWDGVQKYMPHFDRRHNMNFVVAWTMGKNKDWEIDGRWNLGSGFPFTQTAGFYEYITFTDGINSNYLTSNTAPNTQLGTLYGDLNEGRLPYYHRLDINVKKKFTLSENSNLEIAAGATNVYNRKNIFYFDRIQYKRVNQLPIMPSLNVSWTF
jgi:hypothetical protein